MYRLILVLILVSWMHLDIDAQCYPDRHNTTWYDGWISCESSMNPNPERGASHWILYNLGYTYQLGQMHVWNTNAVDYLADGIQTAVIDVSVDGINWIEVGEFEFEQASGKSIYEGFEGPDLSGYEAKFLLITALANWGGECYGLSEIKVDVHGVTEAPEVSFSNDCLQVKAFPNPAFDKSEVSIIATCDSGEIRYSLMDVTGRMVSEGRLEGSAEAQQLPLDLSALQAGSYFLTVEQNGLRSRDKIVKIQ